LTFDFSGKRALVTGAASGIGAACVAALAKAGAARIDVIDLDAGSFAGFDLPCQLVVHAGDVADPALWDAIEAADGPPIDAALLNAGIAGTPAPLAKMDLADWRKVMAVNLDGLFLSLRTAMRQASEGASIVVTASATGVKAEPGTGPYGASKAAVIHLAKIAAKEGARRRIRVNAIAPGGVDTAIWDAVPAFADLVAKHQGDRAGALAEIAAQNTPLGRFESPEEIAAQVMFLLSGASGTITGTTLVTDGGYSL
jgi:NAD(P)-dependent dehydrogenase (short-subunit alcohol dehydrogenase family)